MFIESTDCCYLWLIGFPSVSLRSYAYNEVIIRYLHSVLAIYLLHLPLLMTLSVSCQLAVLEANIMNPQVLTYETAGPESRSAPPLTVGSRSQLLLCGSPHLVQRPPVHQRLWQIRKRCLLYLAHPL